MGRGLLAFMGRARAAERSACPALGKGYRRVVWRYLAGPRARGGHLWASVSRATSGRVAGLAVGRGCCILRGAGPPHLSSFASRLARRVPRRYLHRLGRLSYIIGRQRLSWCICLKTGLANASKGPYTIPTAKRYPLGVRNGWQNA